MAKNKSKKEHEPWYLMYLIIIPIFLVAVVPEGFFTWQIMIIFAVMICIPFIVMWWLYSKSSPRNKNKPPDKSAFELYSENLRESNEYHHKKKEG